MSTSPTPTETSTIPTEASTTPTESERSGQSDPFLQWVAANRDAFAPSGADLARLDAASRRGSRPKHTRRNVLIAGGLALAAALIAAVIGSMQASPVDDASMVVVVNEPRLVQDPAPADRGARQLRVLEPWASDGLRASVGLDWRETDLAALELIYRDARGQRLPPPPGQGSDTFDESRLGPPPPHRGGPPRRGPRPLDLMLERGEEVGIDRIRLEALEDEVSAAEPNRMLLEAEVSAAREAVERVLLNTEWDEQAVRTALDALADAESALRLHDIRMVYQVRELLTDEDVDALLEVFPPRRPERK